VALQTEFCRSELNPRSFLPEVFDRIANRSRKAHEWIGDVMKVDKGLLDSRTAWALQDLLIDVAAVVDATEPDRAGDGSDPDCTYVAALWNCRPGA
jgi:hypothetical protein